MLLLIGSTRSSRVIHHVPRSAVLGRGLFCCLRESLDRHLCSLPAQAGNPTGHLWSFRTAWKMYWVHHDWALLKKVVVHVHVWVGVSLGVFVIPSVSVSAHCLLKRAIRLVICECPGLLCRADIMSAKDQLDLQYIASMSQRSPHRSMWIRSVDLDPERSKYARADSRRIRSDHISSSRSRIEVKGDRLERPGQTVLESQSIGSSSLITNPTGGHGA